MGLIKFGDSLFISHNDFCCCYLQCALLTERIHKNWMIWHKYSNFSFAWKISEVLVPLGQHSYTAMIIWRWVVLAFLRTGPNFLVHHGPHHSILHCVAYPRASCQFRSSSGLHWFIPWRKELFIYRYSILQRP